MTATDFDYVIIGAGTAGCLLANRLSADPTKRVLLLEAGRPDNYHWIHIPVGYLYCIGNPRTDWLYKTLAQPRLNDRKILYPRGKTLGGGSSINGMIYMRGQARDYDAWVKLTGNDEWRWEKVLADFKRHENHQQLDGGADPATGHNSRFSDHHGHGGEWRVEKQRSRWDLLDSFQEAMVENGFARTADFNTGDNEGVGFFQVNQKSGLRWNTTKAFLRPIKDRKNLTVWTQAHTTRLNFDKTASGKLRCSGAVVHLQGEDVTVLARREVILSAGSINSPQLMQLSGLGPVALLRKHGIDVLQDMPGVGQNLQDHLQIRNVFKVKGAATLNTTANSLFGKAKIGLEYALRRTGPMAMSPSQLGAFTRSDASQPYANLQYHVQPLSLDAFGQPLHPFPAMTVSICNLNPTSRGHVSIQSNRWQDAPAIEPNYLDTEQDRIIVAHSVRQARAVMRQPAMAKYQPEEFRPGAQFQSDADLIREAGKIGSTIFHPVGTTKMGRDEDKMAVVDSRLKVRGIEGLRVADAGVMPTIVSGNTNSPTLMIAEKAARFILDDARG